MLTPPARWHSNTSPGSGAIEDGAVLADGSLRPSPYPTGISHCRSSPVYLIAGIRSTRVNNLAFRCSSSKLSLAATFAISAIGVRWPGQLRLQWPPPKSGINTHRSPFGEYSKTCVCWKQFSYIIDSQITLASRPLHSRLTAWNRMRTDV